MVTEDNFPSLCCMLFRIWSFNTFEITQHGLLTHGRAMFYWVMYVKSNTNLQQIMDKIRSNIIQVLKIVWNVTLYLHDNRTDNSIFSNPNLTTLQSKYFPKLIEQKRKTPGFKLGHITMSITNRQDITCPAVASINESKHKTRLKIPAIGQSRATPGSANQTLKREMVKTIMTLMLWSRWGWQTWLC